MKVASRKLRPPIKRHGGKAYLARRIVALMPEHRTYVEPFLGGGSVLLNKPKAELEVAGDLDGDLFRFWDALSSKSGEMVDFLIDVPYTENIFNYAEADLLSPHTDDLVKACGFLIRNRFSRGGLGKTFAWSDRLRGGQPGDVNAWETIKAELPAIAERIEEVRFNCCEARKLIQAYDGPETLHYLDPPYLPETRTAKKAYGEFEMDLDDHVRLLVTAKACNGAVLISGYRSKAYDSFLGEWHRVEFEMPNHSGQGKSKQRRIECIWSNRPFAGDAS